MQTLLVIIIVCIAAAYLVKTLIKKTAGKKGCGGGCSSCQTAETCEHKDAQ